VKAIPAGAYVRIIGMSNLEDDVAPEDEERTYRSKPYWRRLSVAVAGSTMHFLMALVLIFIVFAGFGVRDPETNAWRIVSVSNPSAAFEAGIEPGDRVVAIDGEAVSSFTELSERVRDMPGKSVTLEVLRDGETRTVQATLGDEHPTTGEEVGFLGVGPDFPFERVSPLTAARRSVTESIEFGKQAIGGLAHIFSPSGVQGYVDTIVHPDVDGQPGGDVTEDRPSSIIGVVQIGSQVAEHGLVNLFYLLFGFNIFIGIFNLLPVLPFDGGHVAIATYEKIRSMLSGRRYQADVAKLLPVTYAVVLVLALLFVTTIYLDITHPVSVN
jgi:membrane-associated protease RseP (regulator of RpoE activity)